MYFATDPDQLPHGRLNLLVPPCPALLRLEAVETALAEGRPLTAGEAKLKPVKPGWAIF